MKKIILQLLLVVLGYSVYSQINCNPDPNGPPCWAGGVSEIITAEQQTQINNIQEMTLDPSNIGINLPGSVYNIYKPNWGYTNIHMPEIMNQGSQSMCAQAAITYNVFTYEINYEGGTSAQLDEHNFPPNFTYNYLNGGDLTSPSGIEDGIEILQEHGCPDLVTYEESGIPSDPTKWMSGYSKYDIALKNRVEYAEKIDLSSNNSNGLDLLKYWLYNHNYEPNEIGGVGTIVFQNMFDLIEVPFTSGPFQGMVYVFGLDGTFQGDAHAMTIVGYDDNLVCGNTTGALIIANSWGNVINPQNEGYMFLPYALINFDEMLRKDNNGSIWIYVLHVNPDFKTDYTLNMKLEHINREKLLLVEGHNTTTGNLEPIWPTYCQTAFQNGGIYPLLGQNTAGEPMEVVFDYDFFLGNAVIDPEDVKQFFFGGQPKSPVNAENFLQEFYLEDNRCDPPLSIYYDLQFPLIFTYDETNWFGIDYNRLNENYSIPGTTTITEQTYCHCQTFINNGTLDFSNQEILFYDGEIIIEQGGTLELSNCNIKVKQGINKIIVYGDLIIDENPTVLCDGGSFEIEYHDQAIPQTQYYISGGNFYGQNSLNQISITGLSESLTIENCKFLNTYINYSGNYLTIQQLVDYTEDLKINFTGGNLLVQNNDLLLNTYISASLPDDNQNTVVIQDNLFRNTNSTENKAVISIDDYKIFSVENNEIEINHCNGIELYHAGNNIGANKYVSFNEIYSTNSSNECRAIDVFFSRADILNNNIHHNEYGVVAFGNSETTIMGNKDANAISGTQQFIDNTIHCYFSYSSYPEDIRYNYFEHNATINDPYVKLVYFDLIEPEPSGVDGSVIYNIECNAWYSTFTPEDDLIPSESYDYDPYWNIGQYCVKDGGEAGVLYDEAKEYVDSGYYSQADSNFKEIISDFPEDPHAIQSLRELYNIEESNGNDYDSLRLYYKTVITANQDSLLCRSADWMSMHCLIMMDSSQKAIDWLDSTINIPKNTVDSIFAIINLGYIYTHSPDTTLKSALYTTHNEYIPKSYSDYKIRREELFQELLKSSSNENEDEELTIEKNATIMQIAPNPTQDAFNAKLEIVNEGYLIIELYSALGAKIKEINIGNVQKGIIDRNISLINQPQGMYYVVVKHDNAVQETKKVIKM